MLARMASKVILFFAFVGILLAQIFANPIRPAQQEGSPATNQGPHIGLGVPPLHSGPPQQIQNPIGNKNTPLSSDSDATKSAQKTQEFFDLVRSTLADIGKIAVEDNPEVGAKIVSNVNEEIEKVAQILAKKTTNQK